MNIKELIGKNYKKLIIYFLLIIVYIYITAIENLPSSIILFEGEQININTLLGINVNVENDNYKAILTSSNIKNTNVNTKKGQTTLKVSLLNSIVLKNIEVNVIENTIVVPSGDIAGIKLYAEGIMVVGMSEIDGYKPYINSGIKEGDIITDINGNKIYTVAQLTELVNKSNGNPINITYKRNEETMMCSITPILSEEGEYKIGLWVRDSAAGIGTVTFYEPESGSFVALGHGITDVDTNKLVNIAYGELVTTKVLSIMKGKNSNPGKIQGTIINQEKIGIITKNTEFGIYGKITDLSNLNINLDNKMEVALRNEIKTGRAELWCCVDGEKQVKKYNINIQKIYKKNNYDNKSMLIKINDKELIEETGGIVQGMSGSPIIQNGKFIGALTHVLIDDATIGYAVFGDMMVKQMKEVN